MPKLFNALTGAELKQVILKSIEKRLDNDHRFRMNIAYPVLKYTLSFELEAVTLDPPVQSVVISEHYEQEGVETTSLGESVIVKAHTTVDVDAPDALREALGIPVPNPHVGPGGQIVDF